MDAVGGTSSIAKTSMLMKNDSFQIDPLKAVIYPEKGDKRPNIKDNSILLWKANSLYKIKITVQPLITSKRVKS